MAEENHCTECSKCPEKQAQYEQNDLGYAFAMIMGQVFVPCEEQEGEDARHGQQIDEVLVEESYCLSIHELRVESFKVESL